MHAYNSNVSGWASRLQPNQTSDNLTVRTCRRDRPWLRGDLGPQDVFDYLGGPITLNDSSGVVFTRSG